MPDDVKVALLVALMLSEGFFADEPEVHDAALEYVEARREKIESLGEITYDEFFRSLFGLHSVPPGVH